MDLGRNGYLEGVDGWVGVKRHRGGGSLLERLHQTSTTHFTTKRTLVKKSSKLTVVLLLLQLMNLIQLRTSKM